MAHKPWHKIAFTEQAQVQSHLYNQFTDLLLGPPTAKVGTYSNKPPLNTKQLSKIC